MAHDYTKLIRLTQKKLGKRKKCLLQFHEYAGPTTEACKALENWGYDVKVFGGNLEVTVAE